MRSRSFALVASFVSLAAFAACGGSGSNNAGGNGGGDFGGASSSGTSSMHASSSSATSTGTLSSTSSTSSSSAASTGSGGASTSSSGGSGGTGGQGCIANSVSCSGNTAQICDSNGNLTTMDCPQICVDGLGCLQCVPNTGTCNGNVGTYCSSDGMTTGTETCDPVQGTTCNAMTGRCDGACSPQKLGASYIGCDYYATVTPNLVDSSVFHFAVTASNTTSSDAMVTVTKGATMIAQQTVPANSVGVIDLPWDNNLKGPNDGLGATMSGSIQESQAAYRVRSTQPITLYQFSPLEYTLNFDFSYTNDASLLLPVNSWTGKYFAGGRHTWGFSAAEETTSGFYAVVASQDNTSVQVTAPPGTCKIKSGVPGMNTNCAGTITLNTGDVAVVVTDYASNPYDQSDPDDITGTFLSSNNPIEVISGHECTFIPDTTGYCDHLEESMFPYETLETDYIVTAPLIPGGTAKVEMVRIVATADNTTLTYDPPQSGAPTSIANAGGWVEIANTAADFQVTGSSPILVLQYMEGQDAGGNEGDPAMALAVNKSQYRDNYLVFASTTYTDNFANIVAPMGSTVTLDGQMITSFTPIGGTGYGIARETLSNSGDGSHSATGTMPFGISVYGYGQYTSYWYPGGTDLQKLHM